MKQHSKVAKSTQPHTVQPEDTIQHEDSIVPEQDSVVPEQDSIVSEQDGRIGEGKKIKTSTCMLNKELKDASLPSGSQNAIRLSGSKVHDDTEIFLPEVLDYVNLKYGTPRAQLKKLTEQGYYETVNIDTSGIGLGPIIKCPVESQVLLPTPNHRKHKPTPRNTSENTALLTKDAEDQVKKGSTGSKLVYENGQVAYCRDGLEFESRFESGNLLKAFQM